jgi:ubiquinone/menaquinone biosynthesis C-methylase UbiE
MSKTGSDAVFAGSIPELYDTLLVPLIFEPFAADLAQRAATLSPRRVLETAAGTGAVTRALARSLPAGTTIVATDLNPPMLERAAAVGTAQPVQWQQADALQLPFDDDGFDLVVCQFGAMFFPDKVQAFSEARRVLRPGGAFLFNVWDDIADNEFADVVTQAAGELFPDDPPRFLARTPHGFHDRDTIASLLERAGFAAAPLIETVAARSRAGSAREVAMAYCQGTPLRNEIEARAGAGLPEVTAFCTEALARRYGQGPVDGKIQALVAMARR